MLSEAVDDVITFFAIVTAESPRSPQYFIYGEMNGKLGCTDP